MRNEVSIPKQAAALPRGKPARTGKLSDEIWMVRSLIREVEARARNCDTTEKLLDILESVSHASASLANLLKTEKALEESESASDYVKAALNEIREEMERKGIDSILTSGLG